MPIRIPDGLPARDNLLNEGVRVMTERVAVRQDIRPMRIGLLNLMPNKIRTEPQIARLLGASPLQVEFTLVRVGGHTPKNTSAEHLFSFYNTWEQVKDQKFDGFIITGAPVETLAFEDVTYWNEMKQIFLKTLSTQRMIFLFGDWPAIGRKTGHEKFNLEYATMT